MAGTTDLIKEKLNIVDFIRTYVQLVPAGKNFKGLCPFHKEKTPSFMVSPDRQSWHCFGCGIGGDAFSFLMKYENIEFSDALKILAERTGIELRRVLGADYKVTALLYDINLIAKDFFRKQFENAPVAKKYLADRKLKEETIKEFEIGWAPNDMEALNLHLLNMNFQPEDIVRAGLAFKTERGLQMDRFRGRIMFPIHNHFGKVVGFTGRVLPQFDDGKMGKYVNSPETPIFNKSKLLYGMWRSKDGIREAKRAFLVEGQMDLLMTWQAGVRYAVASSGTAFTPDHLATLARYTDTLYLNFDSDDAGWTAGERAIDLAQSSDFDVMVVTIPGFKDAADAVAADPANLARAIENAMPAMKAIMGRYLGGEGFNLRDRESLKKLRLVLAKIKKIPSAISRSNWVREVAGYTGVDERHLNDEMEKVNSADANFRRQPEEAPPKLPALNEKYSRWERLSQKLIAIAAQRSDFNDVFEKQYLAPGYEIFAEVLSTGATSSSEPDVDKMVNLILLQAEDLPDEEMVTMRAHLKSEYVRARRHYLAGEIRKAEARGDPVAEHAFAKELDDLSKI